MSKKWASEEIVNGDKLLSNSSELGWHQFFRAGIRIQPDFSKLILKKTKTTYFASTGWKPGLFYMHGY